MPARDSEVPLGTACKVSLDTSIRKLSRQPHLMNDPFEQVFVAGQGCDLGLSSVELLPTSFELVRNSIVCAWLAAIVSCLILFPSTVKYVG